MFVNDKVWDIYKSLINITKWPRPLNACVGCLVRVVAYLSKEGIGLNSKCAFGELSEDVRGVFRYVAYKFSKMDEELIEFMDVRDQEEGNVESVFDGQANHHVENFYFLLH